MQVKSITNYTHRPNNKQQSKNNDMLTTYVTKQKGNKQISFGASFGSNVKLFKRYWDPDKLLIMLRTDSDLEDVAEYLHKKGDWEIKEMTSSSRRSADYSEVAYKRLKKSIETVLNKKNKVSSEISKLEYRGSSSSRLEELRAEIQRLDSKADDYNTINELFTSTKLNW